MAKPKLKCTKSFVIKVDYKDLELFVKRIYGLVDYSFVATQECENGSSHSFHIDGKLDTFDKEEVRRIEEHAEQGEASNYAILNLLCSEGYIEPAEYIVGVFW